MKFLTLLFFTFFTSLGILGQLSPSSKVYLLTCDPGAEIYTQFGHSAIRIVDNEASIDLVYNWGMFEFGDDEMEFNLKFAKGKLPYFMGIQPFDAFMAEYIYFDRPVRQSELNLNQEQRNELYLALQENYLPENRVYKYDFFFDNCASRIRDFFVKILGDQLEIETHKDANLFSYRTIITPRLENHPWTHFGINLVLGAPIDTEVTNENLFFLPEYMEQIFQLSNVRVNTTKEPFVLSQETLFEGSKTNISSNHWFTPNVMAWSLFALIVALSFFKWQRALRIVGFIFILFTSILGIILLFMWFGTDHQATKMNFNLIWANPLVILLPFLILTNNMFQRMHTIFRILAFIHLSFIVLWIFIPQEFDLPTKGLILAQGLLFYTWQKETRKPALN